MMRTKINGFAITIKFRCFNNLNPEIVYLLGIPSNWTRIPIVF